MLLLRMALARQRGHEGLITRWLPRFFSRGLRRLTLPCPRNASGGQDVRACGRTPEPPPRRPQLVGSRRPRFHQLRRLWHSDHLSSCPRPIPEPNGSGDRPRHQRGNIYSGPKRVSRLPPRIGFIASPPLDVPPACPRLP